MSESKKPRPSSVELLPSVAVRAACGQVAAPVPEREPSEYADPHRRNVAEYLQTVEAEIRRLLAAHATKRPDGSFRMHLDLRPSQARAIQAEIQKLQALGCELEELLKN